MATNTEKIVVQVVVKGGKQLDNLDKKTGKATKSFGKMALGIAAGVAEAAEEPALALAPEYVFADSDAPAERQRGYAAS